MAALIKRGGKWSVKYRDENGKQVWVKGFTDKGATRELAAQLDDRARAIKLGHIDPIAETEQIQRIRPASDLITAYEQHLSAAGRSSNHVAYTVADIRKAFDFAGVKLAGQITKEQIDAWVLSLTGDSPRTINRRIGSVQAFLRHCQERGAVSKYVLNKYPKRNVKGTEVRKCRHLTPAEVKALIKGTTDTERRDVYRFALLTGFRFSEVGSMTASNINLTQNTVTVQASDAKNKKRHQTIPLHPDLKKMITARMKGKAADVRLFEMPERTDAARLLRSDCEGAKIDPARIMFHSLRHTFITRLAESNIHPKILQTLARHSSLETTLNYYVHFRQADERSAVAALAA